MILIMIFILLVSVGIALIIIDANTDIYITALPIAICTIGGALGVLFTAGVLVGINQSSYIEREISNYNVERLGIEQNYIKSLSSHDKHQRLSALAKITAWNADVELYKENSQKFIICDFYPKEIANTLEYIYIENLKEE